jgi:predicted PurR-regulated permease PerM
VLIHRTLLLLALTGWLQVLSVLVVAEHSLGIWGLLLAVPTTVFALDYCIRYPESTVREVRVCVEWCGVGVRLLLWHTAAS